MKQFFPTSLVLLLVMGSLGQVFAAIFCPRMFGRDCCLTRTASGPHCSQSHQHMQAMAMDTMADENMSMNDYDMPAMTMDDPGVQFTALASDEIPLASTAEELAAVNKVELPIDACAHCMNHSGIQKCAALNAECIGSI